MSHISRHHDHRINPGCWLCYDAVGPTCLVFPCLVFRRATRTHLGACLTGLASLLRQLWYSPDQDPHCYRFQIMIVKYQGFL